MQPANRPRALDPVWTRQQYRFSIGRTRCSGEFRERSPEPEWPPFVGLGSGRTRLGSDGWAARDPGRACADRLGVLNAALAAALAAAGVRHSDCAADQARGLGRLFEQGCQIASSAVCEPATEQIERPSVSWLRASASQAKPYEGISRRDSDSKRVLRRVSSQIPRRVRCGATATIGHRRSSVDHQVSTIKCRKGQE